MKFIRPRIVFLVYFTGMIVFCAASIGARGNAGLAMLNMTLFFESVCFPTIVALGIRGVGKHTKVNPSLFCVFFQLESDVGLLFRKLQVGL